MGVPEACNSAYETARNQRIEENKKRLQELGLTDLLTDLAKSATPTKFSPGRRRGRSCGLKEKGRFQLRRSTRNSDCPLPDYVEVEIDRRRRARFDNTGGTRHYSRIYERKYASEEARMCATEKAEALKKELPQTNVSFVKPMLQSHVTGGFWLGLPAAFCRDHLPKRDDRIVLEDENNEEWETIYLSYKTGLSGGWRGFSLDHGLVDGDALVFELVERRRFKVHIIRVYGSNATSNEEEQVLQEDVKEQGPKSAEKGDCNKVRQRLIWETEHEKGNGIKEDTGFEATEVKCEIGKVEGLRKQKERSDNSDEGYDIKEDTDFEATEVKCEIGKVEGLRKQKERSDNSDEGYDRKPHVHLAQQNWIVKKEMEFNAGIDDSKNVVDLLNINAHENQHLISVKRLKKNGGHDHNFTVKEEMQTGNDDGLDDVKDIVHLFSLFDSNSRPMHAMDITSFMRSKKPSFMRSKKHLDVNVKDRDIVRRRMRQGVLGGFSH